MLNIQTRSSICLKVGEALQVLRILTAVRFADPVSVFNRLALSDAIYILEWQLLPTYTHEPNNELGKENSRIEIHKAFRISAFLYIDMVLREMHSINIRGLVRILIETLQGALGDSFQELVLRSDNELLLWIFFIGGVASKSSEERGYFVRGLGSICEARQIRSCVDFKEAVDKVGPGLQSFSKQSAELWTDMAARNSLPPPLMQSGARTS
jgi:hypothetical protein